MKVDENVIPFYGRSNSTIYNPLNPDKWGYKVFMLCESFTGYCLDVEIYYGKSCTNKHKGIYKTKLSNAIVMHFLWNYKNKNHILFIDNQYNLDMSLTLLENRIFTTGTINMNKADQGIINNLSKVYKNQYTYFENGRLRIMRFRKKSSKKFGYL